MNRLLSGWRGWLAAGLVGCTTVAVALAMPVPLTEPPPTAPPAPLPVLSDEVAAVAARDDFKIFLQSARWGDHGPRTPKRAGSPAPAAPPAPTTNPELARMNYVGLITIHDQRTVLFDVPDVGVVRYVPGDRLPDGRVLVSVTDDSLTLRADGRADEVLVLFPTIENNTRNAAPKSDETEMRSRGSKGSR
ncbi:MAG: hypothetical protein OXU42_09875 [Deltaproteobacteria bacterium]|nr:hypothetical protein [Deltaproteobacteria bacterium]